MRQRMAEKAAAKKQAGIPLERPLSFVEDFSDEAYQLGKQSRRQEFETFELKFKECISKSAIYTKFFSHSTTGLWIVGEMDTLLEKTVSIIYSHKQWCVAERQDLQETLDYMTLESDRVSEEMKNKIQLFTLEVENQVAQAMTDEIRRLDYLVDDFDHAFHPHPGFIRTYKSELHAYIEKGLGTNLKAKCSAPLIESIEEYKDEMKGQMYGLIPASALENSTIPPTPRTHFNVSYSLDVHNLCGDFVEDIEFKFSLGWSSLVNRFIAHRNPKLAMILGVAVSCVR